MRAPLTLALVALFAACTPSEPLPDCTPGAQLACACVGGGQGAQVCGSDARLGACVCPDASAVDVAADVPGLDVAVDVTPQDVTPAADLEVSADSPTADALDASPAPDASGIDATADARTDAPADGPSDAATCDVRCDGACVNTGFDLNNCGGCGIGCRPRTAHTTAQCFAGVCETPCETGWGNCDGNAANGCETNLRGEDPMNCGFCRGMCNRTEVCAMGVCRSVG